MRDEPTKPRSTAIAAAIAVGLPALASLWIVQHGYDGKPFLRGDCPYYFWTAKALLQEHTVRLAHQLPGGWAAHLDQIAWSVDGSPVPKHPIVLPLLSLPFVAAFGEQGALMFNLLQLLLLLFVGFRLALIVARPAAATVAVVATFFASFLPHYVWNYSPDVCSALLLGIGTLLLLEARANGWVFAAGIILGIACVSKFPLVLFLPCAWFLLPAPRRRSVRLLSLGLVLPFALFALFNAHFFGSPFVTSYDRIAGVSVDGVPHVYTQRSSFDLPIAVGMRGQLADPRHGLLATSPITLLALAGIPLLIKRRRALAVFVFGGSTLLFLFFSRYDQWPTSHYGNRFLIPVVALFVIPLSALVDPLLDRARGAMFGRRRMMTSAGT